QTFWLPAGCKPTTSLEKIASSIFNFHANNLRRGEVGVNNGSLNTRGDHLGAESGVEWWVQIRKEDYHADLGMPFHWDKDERLLELKGALVCPAVSTVTYLTDFGAPTVVFKLDGVSSLVRDQRVACKRDFRYPPRRSWRGVAWRFMHRVSIELASTVIESEGNCCVLAQSRAAANGAVVTGNMDQAFVSYPALFKHLAFDGSFLHGVPDVMRRESYEAARRMRVTLLANVWLSHKPSG
ncbi:unnamed protein product, partial [Ascophyllum nodosum]